MMRASPSENLIAYTDIIHGEQTGINTLLGIFIYFYIFAHFHNYINYIFYIISQNTNNFPHFWEKLPYPKAALHLPFDNTCISSPTKKAPGSL